MSFSERLVKVPNQNIQRIAKSVVFCVIRYRSLRHKKPPLLATADVGVSSFSISLGYRHKIGCVWLQEVQ
jgi:hypothetical protein